MVYVRQLLNEIDKKTQSDPTIIFEDNQGALFMASNPVNSPRSKHIDVQHHFIREKVEDKHVRVCRVPTGHQLADTLTKSLGRLAFSRLRNVYLGTSE